MSLQDKTGLMWLDGEWVDWQQATVHALTHTLHYGAGVFEGVRAYQTPSGPAIFRLAEHTQRLFNSAKILNMRIPFTQEAVSAAQRQVIVNNQLTSAYIRPMVFYGGQSLGMSVEGLQVRAMVAAWQWDSYWNKSDKQKTIKVHTSSFNRHHVNTSMCRAKVNGHYVNSILALQEAKAAGRDEALMLDHQGLVAEGTATNVFLVRDGKLLTPSSPSLLLGITRDTIIQFARDLNIPFEEKAITRDEVYICDEMFFTGTATEVTPVGEVDGRMIGDGNIGPITAQLHALYHDVVTGKNAHYAHWLTKCA